MHQEKQLTEIAYIVEISKYEMWIASLRRSTRNCSDDGGVLSGIIDQSEYW